MEIMTAVEQKRNVRIAFDLRAANWTSEYANPDTFRGYSLAMRRRYVLEALLSEPAIRDVLEVGCGTGEYLSALLGQDRRVWCIDASPAMVAQTLQKFSQVPLERLHVSLGDAEAMRFPDATFDGLIAAGVLEYLSSAQKAVPEIKRVLKPKAVAVLTVPNGMSVFALIDHIVFRIVRGFGFVLDALGMFERLFRRKRTAEAVKHKLFNPGRFIRLLKNSGFDIEDVSYCSFGSFAIGNAVPGAVAFSRMCERFRRHPILGLLGVTCVIKLRRR